MKPLRLAVVGVGHLGRIHARLAHTFPGWQLCGVVDPQPEARRAVQRELGVPAYADLSPLAGQIDAAIVATPSATHYQVAAELLEQGVHLLVEKPLVLSVADADDLIARAHQHQRVLHVGHVERFNPALVALRPHLPPPALVVAQRVGPFTGRSMDVGVVWDLMIHDLDIVLTLMQDDPLVEVRAWGGVVVGPNEDWAQAQLLFASGSVATLFASRVGWRPRRTMEIFAPHVLAEIDFASRKAWLAQPRIAPSGIANPELPLTPMELAGLRDRFNAEFLRLTELPVMETNALLEEQRLFYRAITDDTPGGTTGQEARRVIDVAERILTTLALHRVDADHRNAAAQRDAGSSFHVLVGLRGPHWPLAPAWRKAG